MFKSHIANNFLSLFSLYSILRDDVIVRGYRELSFECFLLFGCIGMFGRVGCSTRKLLRVFYRSYNGGNCRNLNHKLSLLLSYGLIGRQRYGNGFRYSVSIHAEKMIAKSLGKESLRDVANYVKSCLKD